MVPIPKKFFLPDDGDESRNVEDFYDPEDLTNDNEVQSDDINAADYEQGSIQ